ncbi:MAG: class I SAM-dependent methyltransferase [Deltaproteobacteria bacterium]|nr:class I SAM-dependent methyltransferase [Deltaproteobacteria bacterium]
MAEHVCPWWIGYLLASPVRKLVHDPKKILGPYVSPGMKVLEPGPGMGFFTVEMAKLVGPQGKVLAIDLQPKMLEVLRRRVRKAGFEDRLDARCAQQTKLGIDDLAGQMDFALLFALVHEVPDQERFLSEIARALAPGKKALFAEPAGHVSREAFERTLATAERCGLRAESRPGIWRSHSAVLVRT